MLSKAQRLTLSKEQLQLHKLGQDPITSNKGKFLLMVTIGHWIIAHNCLRDKLLFLNVTAHVWHILFFVTKKILISCLLLEVSLFDYQSIYDDEDKENICFRYLRTILFCNMFSHVIYSPQESWWCRDTVSIKGYKTILSWPRIS